MTWHLDDNGRHQVVQCDSCPERLDTKRSDKVEARIYYRKLGWRDYKGPDKEFAHSCPPCVADFVADQQAKESRR